MNCCTRCKVNLLIKHFSIKRDGELYKQCEQCEKKKLYRKKSKCPDNKQKWRCVECSARPLQRQPDWIMRWLTKNDIPICEHGVVRRKCVECDGGEICEHSQRRSTCRECDGSDIATFLSYLP